MLPRRISRLQYYLRWIHISRKQEKGTNHCGKNQPQKGPRTFNASLHKPRNAHFPNAAQMPRIQLRRTRLKVLLFASAVSFPCSQLICTGEFRIWRSGAVVVVSDDERLLSQVDRLHVDRWEGIHCIVRLEWNGLPIGIGWWSGERCCSKEDKTGNESHDEIEEQEEWDLLVGDVATWTSPFSPPPHWTTIIFW